MNPQTKAAFEKLLSQGTNKTCIDCDTYNPQWASVSNGVFMCIKCAGTHRSLGVHITFVRSVTMDSWSKIQLARMKCGGNAKLRKFWRDQKFSKNLTIQEKYDNEAMEKYRANLLSQAKGENISPIPFIGYKQTVYNMNKSSSSLKSMSSSSLQSDLNNNNNNNNNSNASRMSGIGSNSSGFGNYDPTENDGPNMNEMLDGLSAWTSNFVAKSSVVASDFAAKSKEVASSLSDKAAQSANQIKEKVNDPNLQNSIKDSANQGWSTMSTWFTAATEKVTTLVNETINDDEPVTFYHKSSSDLNPRKSDPKYAQNAISSDSFFNDNDNNNNSNNNTDNNNQRIQNQNNRNMRSEHDYLNTNNTYGSGMSRSSSSGSSGTSGSSGSYSSASSTRDNDNNNSNNNDFLSDFKPTNETIDEHDDELHTPKSKSARNNKNNDNDNDDDEDPFDDWGFGHDDDDNNDNQHKMKNEKPNQNAKNNDLNDLMSNLNIDNTTKLKSKSPLQSKPNVIPNPTSPTKESMVDEVDQIFGELDDSNSNEIPKEIKNDANNSNKKNDDDVDDWGW